MRLDRSQHPAGSETLYWGFPIALRQLRVNAWHWHPMRLPSVKAARCFEEGEGDFVFNDAEHSYEAVRADITAWWYYQPMNNLRDLQFDELDAAVDDARAMLDSGYDSLGNWTLGQICRHLVLVQDPSVDGYPRWMSLFAFLRPAMRRWLLPKLLSGDSPRGIRTASRFSPPGDLDDTAEVEAFSQSVARLKTHVGEFMPHPAFGRQSPERILAIHTAHAAHHLRFLSPRN